MDPSQSHHPTRRRSLGNLSASPVFPGMWPLAAGPICPFFPSVTTAALLIIFPPGIRVHSGLFDLFALLVFSAVVAFVLASCVPPVTEH